jgi:hypothetical protein
MITPGLTNTVPENLVVEGIPAIPAALQAEAGRYLDFRSAAFQGWHPQRREMIILTRFADTPQLHWVAAPGVGSSRFSPNPSRAVVSALKPENASFFHKMWEAPKCSNSTDTTSPLDASPC